MGGGRIPLGNKSMRGFRVLFLAACLFGLWGHGAEAKCKAHHTSWKTAAQPVVSQPVSTNPEKVLVTWANLMENQRCVDWYTVQIRKEGEEWIRYVNVTGQASTRLEVIVEPCNKYYFQVEFSQQSFWRSKVHQYKSGITAYKTQGIPKIKPTFDWRYDLDINYKLENGVHNLFKPVVSFLKDDMLINGDCIADIQLKIAQTRGGPVARVTDVYKEAKDNFAAKYIHEEPRNCTPATMNTCAPLNHVTRHFNEDDGFDQMQGVYRGNVDAAFNFLERNRTIRCPVVKSARGCPVCRNKRGATGGQFNPTEEREGHSGQTFYPEGSTNGATGGTWQPDRRDQDQGTRGYGGTFVDTSSSHQRRNMHNDRRPRRSIVVAKKGSNKNVVVSPPFTRRVELEMDTSQMGVPCQNPLFVEMVVNKVGGNRTELLKIRDIRIPLIHQSTRLVAPTMSMVVAEIMAGKGKRIPDPCIPLYMLAIDTNVRQTHEEVKFYQNQYEKLENITHKKLEHRHLPVANATVVNNRTRTVLPAKAVPLPAKVATHELPDRQHHKNKEMLKRLGCLCHWSEFVKVTVNDENANYYYPNTTGTYEFTGKAYGGKPYYTHKATSGGDEVTYYLYYYASQDTWYIDDNLGDNKPKLAIVGNYGRCPGDMSIIKVAPPRWQYVKSLVWYNVNHMFVSCGVL